MRNIAIYQDKVFVATTDAHLVALDARTGKTVWDVAIADAPKGTEHAAARSSSTARSSRAWAAATAIEEQKCFISAYDAATGKQLWRFNTIADDGEPGGDTWGKLPMIVPRGRRDVDHRQLRSRSEPHVLGHRAGQAVDAGEPRHVRRSTRRSTRARPSRSTSTPASWRGTSSTRPASRSISTRCSSACSSTVGGQKLRLHRSARPASSGSSIAQTGKFLGHKETVFQNVFDSIDREDRRADATARDIIEHEGRRVDRRLPEHRRRPQLAGDELPPADATC